MPAFAESEKRSNRSTFAKDLDSIRILLKLCHSVRWRRAVLQNWKLHQNILQTGGQILLPHLQ